MAQSVITRQIVVAGGVFAPGHLGELTRIIPFAMAGAVLAYCGAVQRRVRKQRHLTVVQHGTAAWGRRGGAGSDSGHLMTQR